MHDAAEASLSNYTCLLQCVGLYSKALVYNLIRI